VVSGPIVRAAEFLPQLRERHDPRKVDSSRAFFLIFMGLFKKVVIANFLGTNIVDVVFANPKQHGSLEVLVAVYAYAIQIYADFSGYTDIAIGCALLLGIRFPPNFDNPYTATSLRDFWRRWHMTLSRWLRDYLYIPLGGSRGSARRTARNLLLTMLLGGLWHGAAWTFVVWGGLHGAGLVAERALAGRLPRLDPAVARIAGRVVTFHLVCLAWVFFRADSLGTAFGVLGRLVGGGGAAPLVTLPVVLLVAGGVAVQYLPRPVVGQVVAGFSRLAPALQGVAMAAALLVIGVLGPQGIAPFIYYRF
jgi:alginate O-acetyltransferase complex protein AlgI